MMKLEKFKEEKNKKKRIIIFTVCCVLLIVGVFFYESFALFETRENFNFIEGQVQDPEDLYFAYYVEDVITYEMPSKDSGYTLSNDSSCTNGVTVSWDIPSWSAVVNYSNFEKENNSRTKCNLYFRKMTFAEAVIACTKNGNNTTQCMKDYENLEENLLYDETNDNNLRYVGASPSNYVYFNCDDNANPTAETCELWRIIGAMNNIDDGTGTKETRIKLIRDESIGEFSWDTSDESVNGGYGVNEWSQADAMKLLNPGYESESVGGSLYWNRKSGNCYYSHYNFNKPCDFSASGLKETAKSMIGESVWNTVTMDRINRLVPDIYTLERSDNAVKSCTDDNYCNDTVSRTATWTGYVGLMYLSDFGYATNGGTTMDRNACLRFFNYSTWDEACLNHWLNRESRWTISPYSTTNSQSFYVYFGEASDSSKLIDYYPNALVPVVYLKSNVKITNGEGSVESPFILTER